MQIKYRNEEKWHNRSKDFRSGYVHIFLASFGQ